MGHTWLSQVCPIFFVLRYNARHGLVNDATGVYRALPGRPLRDEGLNTSHVTRSVEAIDQIVTDVITVLFSSIIACLHENLESKRAAKVLYLCLLIDFARIYCVIFPNSTARFRPLLLNDFHHRH